MKRLIFLCLSSIVLLLSCGTPKEAITNYLEKTKDTTGTNLINLVEPVIQKNDLLTISVKYIFKFPVQIDIGVNYL